MLHCSKSNTVERKVQIVTEKFSKTTFLEGTLFWYIVISYDLLDKNCFKITNYNCSNVFIL